MHLLPPLFTTTKTSKKKPKKWASSEQKPKQMELESSWNDMMKKYPPLATSKKIVKKEPTTLLSNKRTTDHIPSIDTGGFAARKDTPKYTGTKLIGIATMHKSNLVPIFDHESAKDVARMRRG